MLRRTKVTVTLDFANVRPLDIVVSFHSCLTKKSAAASGTRHCSWRKHFKSSQNRWDRDRRGLRRSPRSDSLDMDLDRGRRGHAPAYRRRCETCASRLSAPCRRAPLRISRRADLNDETAFQQIDAFVLIVMDIQRHSRCGRCDLTRTTSASGGTCASTSNPYP